MAMAQYLVSTGWETVSIANSGTGFSWAVTASIYNRTVRGNEMAYLTDMCRVIDRHQDLLKAGN
jgi:hypothetical protein